MRFSPPGRFLLGISLFASYLAAQSTPSEPVSQSGIDLSAIDKSVEPCQDFYQYACGTWMKTHPIPPDQASWGSFNVLHERNQQILKGLLEDSAAHQDRSEIDAKIGGYYASCMNEAGIETLGIKPLQPELDRIRAIADRNDLLDEVVHLHQQQITVFFGVDAMADPKNATMTIADVDQSGLGLPERDFYLRTDAKSVEIRQKYLAHVTKIFTLIGVPPADAAKKANAVLKLETALAKASLDVTSRRDPQLLVHSLTRAQLQALSPNFDFNQYFVSLRSPQFDRLNVAVPAFVQGFNQELAQEPLDNIKDYLAWQYVTASASKLPKAFVQANFEFYSKTLYGVEVDRPRWKRCVSSTDSELGEALGKRFVEKTFGEQGKAKTLQMVNQIETQMGRDIDSLTWLSDQTKAAAHQKLKKVTNKIGYPDKWRDYSSVTIKADDYFGNFYRANEFEWNRQLAKIGKPVDRSEWEMTPPTVNAYYNPNENNINFPAGILQPPFFSNAASGPVNLGAIGVVVGHELTHGFDDQGRQYDGDGNLKDWWTKQDAQEFDRLAQCFVNQYGSFSPVKGVELNGKLTLGENAADNGGARLAYMALMADLANRTGAVPEKLDGYTPEQQFFLGFAQVWCENTRPELERTQAQTDPHSPGRFRVIGVVQNSPQFGTAFGCKPPSPMQSVKSCRVW